MHGAMMMAWHGRGAGSPSLLLIGSRSTRSDDPTTGGEAAVVGLAGRRAGVGVDRERSVGWAHAGGLGLAQSVVHGPPVMGAEAAVSGMIVAGVVGDAVGDPRQGLGGCVGRGLATVVLAGRGSQRATSLGWQVLVLVRRPHQQDWRRALSGQRPGGRWGWWCSACVGDPLDEGGPRGGWGHHRWVSPRSPCQPRNGGRVPRRRLRWPAVPAGWSLPDDRGDERRVNLCR